MNVTPIVYKSIECGAIKTPHGEQPVLIERLYVRGEGGLLPYRVRYRFSGGAIQDVLYLENLEAFHRDKTGCPLTLRDPVAFYVDAAMETQYPYPDAIHRLWERLGPDQYRRYFSYGTLNGREITSRLDRVIFGHPHPAADLEFPRIYQEDSLTANFPCGEVMSGQLDRYFDKGPAMLTDIPRALPTEGNVGETLTTPRTFSTVAAMLNDLVMTDLDLKYILLQGVLSEPEVFVAFDRFAHLVPILADQRVACARIAEQAFSALQVYLHHNPEHSLNGVQDLSLRFSKTFNDEALFLFQPYRKTAASKGAGLSVHIDLALLGLCAPGVAVT